MDQEVMKENGFKVVRKSDVVLFDLNSDEASWVVTYILTQTPHKKSYEAVQQFKQAIEKAALADKLANYVSSLESQIENTKEPVEEKKTKKALGGVKYDG